MTGGGGFALGCKTTESLKNLKQWTCALTASQTIRYLILVFLYYKYGARFLLVLGAMKGYEVELRLD